MSRSVPVSVSAYYDRRRDVDEVVARIDKVGAALLQLRMAFSVVGMLYEWRDSHVSTDSPEYTSVISFLRDLYDGLDLTPIEEFL